MKRIFYFTAPWCAACKNLEPHLDEVKKLVTIVHIDITTQPELSEQFTITSLPTLVYMVNYKEVGRSRGMSKKTLEDLYSFARNA